MTTNTNFFTIYWRDGKRQFISGESVEQAFTNVTGRSFLTSAAAIDWYDNGVTRTHWYDTTKKEWVKVQDTLNLHVNDIKDIASEDIKKFIEQHQRVVVNYENKNNISIFHNLGIYYIDHKMTALENIEVSFGSFEMGSEDGYSTKDHWMVSGGQYFQMEEVDKAIDSFKTRAVQANPWKPSTIIK